MALLHGLAGWVLLQAGWNIAIYLVAVLGVFQVLRHGLKCLPWSVRSLWLESDGWFLRFRNGHRAGPFHLTASSRLDAGFIRLSLRSPQGIVSRHLLLTQTMTGAADFRRLQLFLRWAPEKNQPIAT